MCLQVSFFCCNVGFFGSVKNLLFRTQNILEDHVKTLGFSQELRIIINLILISAFVGGNIFDLACVHTQQYVENNKNKTTPAPFILILQTFFSAMKKGRGPNNTIGMNHIAGCPFRKCSSVIKARV